MITSDVNSSSQRPASPGALTNYRSVSAEAISAAARANVAYPRPVSLNKIDTSRYEFPGDRSYQQFLARRDA